MRSLEGKRALVTGAGTGIGAGVAKELARQGASVVLHFAHSAHGAQRAAQVIRDLGGNAATIQGNLSVVADCQQVVDQTVQLLGGLDILVNNAGVTEETPFLQSSPDQLDKLFHLNIRGYFFCAQQAARWMSQNGGGNIVNMSSIHAWGGLPGHAVYAATKGAINAFTRQVAVELIPKRIRVNCVAPGHVKVERFEHNPNYAEESAAARVPWGRVGLPVDIGKTVAFLVSDDADFIIGQIVYVDGGLTATLAHDLTQLA